MERFCRIEVATGFEDSGRQGCVFGADGGGACAISWDDKSMSIRPESELIFLDPEDPVSIPSVQVTKDPFIPGYTYIGQPKWYRDESHVNKAFHKYCYDLTKSEIALCTSNDSAFINIPNSVISQNENCKYYLFKKEDG